MVKCLYMKITRDKYELPIGCGRSERELAETLGITVSAVSRGLRRGTYIKVEWEEEDDDGDEELQRDL